MILQQLHNLGSSVPNRRGSFDDDELTPPAVMIDPKRTQLEAELHMCEVVVRGLRAELQQVRHDLDRALHRARLFEHANVLLREKLKRKTKEKP